MDPRRRNDEYQDPIADSNQPAFVNPSSKTGIEIVRAALEIVHKERAKQEAATKATQNGTSAATPATTATTYEQLALQNIRVKLPSMDQFAPRGGPEVMKELNYYIDKRQKYEDNLAGIDKAIMKKKDEIRTLYKARKELEANQFKVMFHIHKCHAELNRLFGVKVEPWPETPQPLAPANSLESTPNSTPAKPKPGPRSLVDEKRKAVHRTPMTVEKIPGSTGIKTSRPVPPGATPPVARGREDTTITPKVVALSESGDSEHHNDVLNDLEISDDESMSNKDKYRLDGLPASHQLIEDDPKMFASMNQKRKHDEEGMPEFNLNMKIKKEKL